MKPDGGGPAQNERQAGRCGFSPLEAAAGGAQAVSSRHIRRGPGHVRKPEAKGFDCTPIWRKQAHTLYNKSTSWRVRLGLLEQTFAISRAACRRSLLDFGVFPDLEGAFPDPEKYFQNLYIAVMALDLQ